jgi:outer membrane protein TolC
MLTAARVRLCSKVIAIFLALFAGPVFYGQSELTGTSQRTVSYGAAGFAAQAGYASDSQPQSPYLGAVPAGTVSPTPLSLSLEDAVARGLRQNLGGLFSTDAVSGARGERWQALSALLPNLTTGTSLGVRQIAMGPAPKLLS